MLNKKNYILFIVLIVLLAVSWLYFVPYQKKEPALNNFLAQVDITDINKISVIQNDIAITINKNNGAWTVEPDNWPMEQELADVLIEKLISLTALDFEEVSIEPAKKRTFQTGENGLQVALYEDNEEVANFVIGKVTRDYENTYLSQNIIDNTYQVKEVLARAFDIANWKDKTIFSLDAEKVKSITFKYPTYEFAMTNEPDLKGEVYWRVIDPLTRLNKDKTEEMRDTLINLEASSVPKQNLQKLGKNNLIITIKTEDVEDGLIIGDLQGKEYFVKKQSTGRIFLISKSDRNKLFKQIKDLR